MKFLNWLRQKWIEFFNRIDEKNVIRIMMKMFEMNKEQGEARIWGDKETVQDVARFYEKFKLNLITVVEIRKLTGKNTATGLLDDMRRCFIELENDRLIEKKKLEKKKFEEQKEKQKEVFKRYS